MLEKNLSAKQLVKKLTAIPESFVDELYDFYDENTLQTDFVIDLDYVVKWINTKKFKLLNTLKESYKKNIDYTLVKSQNPNKKDPRNNNYKRCFITPDCFKRLCMMSRAKNAEMVRTYFIEVESIFLRYKENLIEGLQNDIKRLENNQKPKARYKKGDGYIYVFKASPYNDDILRIGSTRNLRQRLANHTSSHADELEVLYIYKTEDVKGVETCVKGFIDENKYRKNKEVYEVDLNYVKKIIGKCAGIGRYKIVYQRRKALTHQEGGYYVAIYKGEPKS
jgi:phage anti-repressor protein